MKPALPEKSALVRLCFGDAQLFRGPAVLGIREISLGWAPPVRQPVKTLFTVR
jgi:hypothetical protein